MSVRVCVHVCACTFICACAYMLLLCFALFSLLNKFRLQKSYKNFSYQKFAKDQNTLIEQSIVEIMQKIFSTKILCKIF